jgi:secretion/DNA translocation related CpaE-like protein
MPAPLLVSRDPHLLDEVARLAAAAGVAPELRPPDVSVLQGWALAPLVLVGADAAAEVVALAPPRRAHVHLCTDREGEAALRTALALGAERVLTLPSDAAWLTERLIDAGDGGSGRGHLVGVLAGSGGAGATTFACALGQVAARSGPAVVVDADPWGPGVDRVLGLDATPGVRWPDLESTTGRLGARALRESLPARENLAALAWPAGGSAPVPLDVLRECVSAARRGHDLVVVDLPRGTDPVVTDVVSRCDLVVVLASPTVCGTASATSSVARFERRGRWGLVVRGRGLDPDEVARVTGLPLLAEMSDQRRVAESVDLGLGPVRSRRGPLARAAAQVLAEVGR